MMAGAIGLIISIGLASVVMAQVSARGENQEVVGKPLEARILAARGFLYRADVQKLSSDCAFYAGRVLGFEELGKPVGPLGADDPFPNLLAGEVAGPEAVAAFRAVDLAPQPFLWCSPTGRHHGGPVRSVAVSLDGTTLASGSEDKIVKLWDVKTGQEKAILRGHRSAVLSVSFSGDGKTLASGSDDGSVMLWDVGSGKQKGSLVDPSGTVFSVAFSPDGKTLATGSDDFAAKLWDVASGTVKAALEGHSEQILAVAFSPDGQTLATGSADNTVKLWDVLTIAEKATLRGHSERVRSLVFARDGQTLISGSEDRSVKVWDVATGSEKRCYKAGSLTSVAVSLDGRALAGACGSGISLWTDQPARQYGLFNDNTNHALCVAFSGDGRTLACGLENGMIKFADVATGKEKADPRRHSDWISTVAFSPDGRTLASGSRDKTVKLWDLQSGKEVLTLVGHSSSVESVAFSPDGQTLATASADKTVRIWDFLTGKEKRSFDGHNEIVRGVAFSADGQTLASCSWHTIIFWDLSSGKARATLPGFVQLQGRGYEGGSFRVGVTSCVAFSGDGRTLASGTGDSVKLWDVTTGNERAAFRSGLRDIWGVAFSADGQTVAAGGNGNGIELWNAASGKKTATLLGHSDSIFAVAFSPDGKTLASVSRDQTVRLWDVQAGREMANFLGHLDFVHTVAFSPDGQTLASGSMDQTIRLWDVARGKEKVAFKGHKGDVFSIDFSPDGTSLACGGNGDEITLWDVAGDREKTGIRGKWSHIDRVRFRGRGELLAGGDAITGGVNLWEVVSGAVGSLLNGRFAVGSTADAVSVDFSPDGRTLGCISRDRADRVVRLWDVPTGRAMGPCRGHLDKVCEVAFSADGKTVASASEDNTVRLWDVATAKQKATFKGHKPRINCLAFSPTGQILASGSDDKTVKLWDLSMKRERATFRGHLDGVRSLAFSPSGQILASAGGRTLMLWDVVTGTEKAAFQTHQNTTICLAFSPNGQALACGGLDKTVKVFELAAIVHPNLFDYVREGWCRFDTESEALVWAMPHRKNLYRPEEMPFRNVPRWSSLGILQRADLSAEKKNWFVYLEALEAENWASAAILYDRLPAERKRFAHANVIWAIRSLIEQAKKAQGMGLMVLAEMRLGSARKFQAELPAENRSVIPSLETRKEEDGK